MLFFSGGCFSVYNGVVSIMSGGEVKGMDEAILMLGLSGGVEATTLGIAYNALRTNAKEAGMGTWDFIKVMKLLVLLALLLAMLLLLLVLTLSLALKARPGSDRRLRAGAGRGGVRRRGGGAGGDRAHQIPAGEHAA